MYTYECLANERSISIEVMTMIRKTISILRSALLVASVVGLMMPTIATAGIIYELQATSLIPAFRTDFAITFDDTDGDSLFSGDEFIAFSGVTLIAAGNTYTQITNVPAIPNIADGGAGFWRFVNCNGCGTNANVDPVGFWSYAVSPIAADMPTPATLALFGLGLVGLGINRRKRQIRG